MISKSCYQFVVYYIGGAPIDPFIAQQILSKITFEQKVKDVAVAEQNNLLSTRNLKFCNWLLGNDQPRNR